MYIKREISKEEYEEARSFSPDELQSKFCTVSEVCGYGVYGIKLINDDKGYFVGFTRGDSCD